MDKQSTRKKRRKGRSRALLIILLVLLAVVLAAALWLVHQPDAQPAPEATATAAIPEPTIAPTATVQLQIDPNAGALITPTPAPVEPGVAIPGWGSMTIPAGITEVATSMQNPEANEGWYYLTFELRLKDTGEVIFTTGLIPPGQYCNKVTLSRALEAGEYAAVIHVQPYRISDMSPTNNADMETVLIVE